MPGRKRAASRRKSAQHGGSIGSVLGGLAKVALPLLGSIFSGNGQYSIRPVRVSLAQRPPSMSGVGRTRRSR